MNMTLGEAKALAEVESIATLAKRLDKVNEDMITLKWMVESLRAELGAAKNEFLDQPRITNNYYRSDRPSPLVRPKKPRFVAGA